MAVTSLIICQIERRGLKFAKSFVGKKMFSFDWDALAAAKPQYENISELTLQSLREDSPGYDIHISDGPNSLPDAFDYEGVVYSVKVERK